jgi:hypothetical protein
MMLPVLYLAGVNTVWYDMPRQVSRLASGLML